MLRHRRPRLMAIAGETLSIVRIGIMLSSAGSFGENHSNLAKGSRRILAENSMSRICGKLK